MHKIQNFASIPFLVHLPIMTLKSKLIIFGSLLVIQGLNAKIITVSS